MKPILIENQSALSDCLPEISAAPELSIDLEFDKNRFRYGFTLCLMQIAAGDACFLLDPIAHGLNVQSVFPMLQDADKPKVVFAFGEDLRLLHSMGSFPRGLYDIKMATSLLNYPPASLTNLLDEILGVQLGQSAQNSNWHVRPLTENQIIYAADDVIYLSALREEVDAQVRKNGIEDWVVEENLWMESASHADAVNNVLFRNKDKMNFTEFSWAVYKALIEFREEVAEEINRPGYQVIHKDFLTALAKDPDQLKQWGKVRGIHRKAENPQVRKRLSDALERALFEASEAGWSKTKPASPKPTPEEFARRREAKARVDEAKKTVFDPIKKKLLADFGEHAATFMLSNRNINDIILGDFSSLRPYKRKLFTEYADRLGVNIQAYLNAED